MHCPNKAQLGALPYLMIETMIAEAILPIAAIGSFGHFSGVEFLQMIQRKALWLKNHHHSLISLFNQAAEQADKSGNVTK